MKHSDYDYLTNAIEAVSAGAELLWMEQHPVDSPEKLDLPKVKRLMEKCANYPYVGLAPPLEERLPTPDTLPEWVEDKSRMALTCMRGVEDDFYKIHQPRADQGLKATIDMRALYASMFGYISGHEIESEYYNRKLREKCRKWMDVAITWYPDLTGNEGEQHKEDNQQAREEVAKTPQDIFRMEIQDKKAYKEAIENGDITEPFTWHGSIADLAEWLSTKDVIQKDRKGVLPTRCLWRYADRVFTINGKQITSKQLKNASQH